jgi:hypothetical protein
MVEPHYHSSKDLPVPKLHDHTLSRLYLTIKMQGNAIRKKFWNRNRQKQVCKKRIRVLLGWKNIHGLQFNWKDTMKSGIGNYLLA